MNSKTQRLKQKKKENDAIHNVKGYYLEHTYILFYCVSREQSKCGNKNRALQGNGRIQAKIIKEKKRNEKGLINLWNRIKWARKKERQKDERNVYECPSKKNSLCLCEWKCKQASNKSQIYLRVFFLQMDCLFFLCTSHSINRWFECCSKVFTSQCVYCVYTVHIVLL